MLLERWLYAWRARLRALLDGDRADRELDDELQHHVAREIEARSARGVPPDEARRQALAALGGLAPTRERVRESRFGAALGEGLRDVRYGLRLLRRHAGFTAATVMTLTLAIGATTAIFSVVDAVLLQPPSFPEPERLVTLWQTEPDNGNRPVPVGPADFLRAGRWFGACDDAEQPPVVVINETLAQHHWPDSDAIGRRVFLSVAFRGRIDAEIVGVVGAIRPGGYSTPPRPEVFVPHA